MKRLSLLVLSIFLLSGCTELPDTESIDETHLNFLKEKGWTVDKIISEDTNEVYMYPELIEQLQGYGLDLSQYNQTGTEAETYTYLLKEKQTTDDNIEVIIYEVDEKIIGGYGTLEEWEPGGFSLDHKNKLVEEGIVVE